MSDDICSDDICPACNGTAGGLVDGVLLVCQTCDGTGWAPAPAK